MSSGPHPRRIMNGLINLNSPSLRVWTVCWAAFLFWAFVGFVIPMGFASSKPDVAGQFGDMFGAVNSLFSGLAFCGILYTLLQQHKQLEASQITARIESFLFMAELQYRLMNDAPDGRHAPFKNSARYCLARSIELMRSLGEDFPGTSKDVIGTAFYSHADYALVELVQIYKMFSEAVRNDNNEQPNTMGARHAVQLMRHDMQHWIERYRHFVNTENIHSNLMAFDAVAGAIQMKPNADTPDYDAKKREWDALWMQFTFATFALKQNVRQLLKDRKPSIDMAEFEAAFGDL